MAITGRKKEALVKVAKEVEAASGGQRKPLEIVADLLDDLTPKKLVDETIKKFGKLDILVSSSATNSFLV